MNNKLTKEREAILLMQNVTYHLDTMKRIVDDLFKDPVYETKKDWLVAKLIKFDDNLLECYDKLLNLVSGLRLYKMNLCDKHESDEYYHLYDDYFDIYIKYSGYNSKWEWMVNERCCPDDWRIDRNSFSYSEEQLRSLK